MVATKLFDAILDVNGNKITNLATPSAGADAVNKDYADALLATTDALLFKGGIDASTNPNYPAGDAGHVYKITVAGKIGGASGVDVEAGDTLFCITDGSASGNQATVGTNWIIIQSNLDASSESVAGFIEIATQSEVNTGTDDSKAVTPLKLATYVAAFAGTVSKYAATITTVADTPLNINHGLNTTDIVYKFYDSAKNEVDVEFDIVDANNATVTTANAKSNARIVIIG